jgi:hypothetical protein
MKPVGLAIDHAFVYWTCAGARGGENGSVARVSTKGGGLKVLVPALTGASGVAVDWFHVYWTIDHSQGELWRADKDGRNPVLVVDGQDHPHMLFVAKEAYYWLNRGSGAGNGSVMALAK